MSLSLLKSSAPAVAAPRRSRAATVAPLCSSAHGCHQPFRSSAAARRPAAVRVQASAQPSVEQRWDAQVVEGKVRNVTGSDIKSYLADGWTILDVRPPSEANKARIVGAVEVPLFVEDEEVSLGSFIKRASAFGMGGWWLGGSHMVPNPNFMGEVQAKIPKSAKVIVGCQKGLRSLAGCEQLSLAGYETLAWVNGGFDSCRADEVPTVGDVDIRYAGIGGLSEAIGWTEVQQEQNKGLGSVDGALKVVGLILAADLLLFASEYVQAYLEGKVSLPSL
ncbi:hypothetical protein CHLRE_13g602650v5 [Chlamydomonas reinhardtii]|uniref:Rhodanese domain-containing protein n=1 Tax=Chlamydomonas reinhardtii TaxID=3055 RepID=A0A2K3D1A1_CHLRE|nr:uncharacterized protein CHLRE_13g602650v5 [Chlamydomonas reinhardtii]PNW74315.1 hypothetical protein CHLRE_13g602650v5 [Chlamydomonas reinhardtii]